MISAAILKIIYTRANLQTCLAQWPATNGASIVLFNGAGYYWNYYCYPLRDKNNSKHIPLTAARSSPTGEQLFAAIKFLPYQNSLPASPYSLFEKRESLFPPLIIREVAVKPEGYKSHLQHQFSRGGVSPP